MMLKLEGALLISSFISLVMPFSNDILNINTLPLPIHCLKGASPTHTFCNERAVQILYNDNYKKEANFFSHYSRQLAEGTIWADKGFKSLYHFYDVKTGSGKWNWPDSTVTCEMYFNKALQLWTKKKQSQAIFYLGAATHLIQDMCVPHHACCVFSDGHVNFEKWVRDRREEYGVYDGGIYLNTISPKDWIHQNAEYSSAFYPFVQKGNIEKYYHLSASRLLPRTQRTTSGFWLMFYRLSHYAKA